MSCETLKGRLKNDIAEIGQLMAKERRQAFDRRESNRLIKLRDDCVKEFARLNGWKVAGTSFGIKQLQRQSPGVRRGEKYWVGNHPEGLDHPEYFKDGRKPAAIITHTYAPLEQIRELARAHQLNMQVLAVSWYYPGRATAVVLTPMDATGPALPEVCFLGSAKI